MVGPTRSPVSSTTVTVTSPNAPETAATPSTRRTCASTAGRDGRDDVVEVVAGVPETTLTSTFSPDGGDQLVERLRDRVREDEGPGDQRDPEDDGQQREGGAGLALAQAAEGESGHGRRLDRLHELEDGFGGAGLLVAHDPAVDQDDEAVGVGGGVGVVGDHHDGLAEVVGRPRAAGPSTSAEARRVQVARGLVGEHHRGLVDERPGDRDALLLAAGELRRPVRDGGR